MNIKPFTLNIADDEIDELKNRLKLTRWPDELPNAGWEYGIPLDGGLFPDGLSSRAGSFHH